MFDGVRLTFPTTTIQGTTFDPVFVTDVTTVEHSIRTGSIQAGGNVLSGLRFLLEQTTGQEFEQDRQTISLDYGGGVMSTELRLQSWEGSDYTWGSDDGHPVTDATGENAITQLQLLNEVFRRTRIDATQPLTLEVYEYSEEGRFSPLEVIPEQPQLPFDPADESSTFEASLTFLNVADLQNAVDAISNDGK